MLHILLFILKIIGIVLLCILGILLLVTACALFVPVRYRIEAVRKEGEGEPPVAVTVKVTWLLHFVNVLVRFNNSLSVRVRLMFITVFGLPKKEKRGKAKADEAGGGKKREKRKNETERDDSGTESGKETSGRETAAEIKTGSPGSEEKRKEAEARNAVKEQTDKETKKPTLWEKLRAIPEILCRIFAKIRSIFENIQYTIQNICDKIRSVSDTIEYYKGVIEGETFQRSFALCKGELLTIFKKLKPDRFEAALIVGMDDPATTGEILAVCGMLYPFFGPKVNVAGDFEKKRLEGRVFIKGKLRFYTFVRVAVRVYFNKDIRKLYRLLKKEAV